MSAFQAKPTSRPDIDSADEPRASAQDDADGVFTLPSPKRIDLHCHSTASSVAGEALLKMIACPESLSPPDDVYAQAMARGMDFVTLTDHDTLAGALELVSKGNVLTGEEITCFFPEDHCKMHVLVYGITRPQHERLQQRAHDIYELAEYLELHQIAHSVAHPLYRQNDRLERWHFERLLLLFKGFECLNGAHSAIHADALNPALSKLDRKEIGRLADVHDMVPRWRDPWYKARTGGSDDHGLLNVGRTWTEFPHTARTTDDLLQCLREGTCRPGGEAGSSVKLAHQFFSVGLRYAHRQSVRKGRKPSLTAQVVQSFAGAAPMPGLKQKLKHKARSLVTGRSARKDLNKLLLESMTRHFAAQPSLSGQNHPAIPKLADHEAVFALVNKINQDFTSGLFDRFISAAGRSAVDEIFESLGQAVAQQFVLAPYYFALFHQNKERHLLGSITKNPRTRTAGNLKVGLFTDTFDDINGVGRFIRDMGEQARANGFDLTIHTSVKTPRFDVLNRKNFEPMLHRPMPFYETLDLSIPPAIEMLEFADRQQYDVIHVSTPGPVGFAGYMAAKMLRVPMLSTYHTDFPAYVEELTKDHRMSSLTGWFMGWFYKQSARVFSRSGAYQHNLQDIGVKREDLRTIFPGINTFKFNPRHRDESYWQHHGVTKPFKLLYVGRISTEKNLPLMVEMFKQIASRRDDVQLIITGEGPYEKKMKAALAGLPVTFTGPQNDAGLGPIYANSTLFLFPSRTDTLGQVVMESQASGLPTLVSNEGGPKEIIEPDRSGLVLNANDPDNDARLWADAVCALLDHPTRLSAMSDAALERAKRYDLNATFHTFWNEHLAAYQSMHGQAETPYTPVPPFDSATGNKPAAQAGVPTTAPATTATNGTPTTPPAVGLNGTANGQPTTTAHASPVRIIPTRDVAEA